MADQKFQITYNLTLRGETAELSKTANEIAATYSREMREDFGPDAWGGYEGPKITGKVKREVRAL